MILTCPACATSYFVPDTAIPASGRRVRCKSCGNDWRALGEDAPLDLGEVAAATAPGNGAAQETPVEEIEINQPLPQAFRARAEQKRRTRKAIQQGLAWGLTAVLVLVGLLLAYLWRDSIVARVPKLASAYQAIGISTNPFGLEFEAVSTGFARNDVSRVYVSGAVRNIRDREIVIPPIRIGVLDATGREIGHRIIRVESAPVLPGKVEGFAAILPNDDGRFAEATLAFVREDEAPARAEPARKPAAAEKSPPSPAAPAQAPAKAPAKAEAGLAAPVAAPAAASGQSAAATDGLRRVSQLAPANTIGRTTLDTNGVGGVSARHG